MTSELEPFEGQLPIYRGHATTFLLPQVRCYQIYYVYINRSIISSAIQLNYMADMCRTCVLYGGYFVKYLKYAWQCSQLQIQKDRPRRPLRQARRFSVPRPAAPLPATLAKR